MGLGIKRSALLISGIFSEDRIKMITDNLLRCSQHGHQVLKQGNYLATILGPVHRNNPGESVPDQTIENSEATVLP